MSARYQRIHTERSFSLGLINDAFHLGYHCWWIVGFVLSFGLFTVVLAFVAGVLDNQQPAITTTTIADERIMRNLGENNPKRAEDTLDRISRLEGARRSLGYPLLRTR